MKKVTRFIILMLIALALVSCDGAVDKLLLHEYTVTYKDGTVTGDTKSTNTTNGYHNIFANSPLELSSNRALDDSDEITRFYKQNYSFYGWMDEEGNYYHHSNDASKNSIKLKKDLTLEALWRNDITGEILSDTELKKEATIKHYNGDADSLIIPEVITIWNGTQHTDYLVTQIGNGTDSIADSTSTLTTVVLPESITTIKENAFTSCTNLTNVEIESTSLESVETNAFPDNQNLKIEVPETVVDDYQEEFPQITNKIEAKTESKVAEIFKKADKSVKKITLADTTKTLNISDTFKLNYTISPSNATNLKVTFASDNTDVATVDKDGKVTAIAAGTSKITVNTVDGNKTAICTVTVKPASISVTGITLNKTSASIFIEKTDTLSVTAAPTDATNKAVTWSTSDKDIVSVDTNGVIKGIKTGKATITATANDGSGKTATCDVKVCGYSDCITFSSPNSFTLGFRQDLFMGYYYDVPSPGKLYSSGTKSNNINDWTELTGSSSITSQQGAEGKYYIYLCGDDNPALNDIGYLHTNICLSSSANDIELSGNIMALLDYNDLKTKMDFNNNKAFEDLFSNCDALKSAEFLQLPATSLAEDCYSGMFNDCTFLEKVPTLPATELADYCYNGMFFGCTSLTEAPELPATTLADYCYSSMFSGCTSLTKVPALPAKSLADYCYIEMFSDCTSLETVPELPATTLAVNCYDFMFYDCTSLETTPELPATTLADYCYIGMFSGCTLLETAPELPSTTLAEGCYGLMFSGCTALKTAPELKATTLANDCYSEMFNGCTSLNIKSNNNDNSGIPFFTCTTDNSNGEVTRMFIYTGGTFFETEDTTGIGTPTSGNTYYYY